ncbi:carboxypeptidase regulatory-like domain-containing protein [Mucilaginibacter sp. UYNi724]
MKTSKKPYLYLVILCLFSFGSSAQGILKITGTVADSAGKGLSRATVTVSRHDDHSIILYGNTDANGSYSLDVPKNQDTIIVSVTYLGYNKSSFTVMGLSRMNNFQKNFILLSNSFKLREVRITAPPPKVSLRRDTISFKADSFRNKNERLTEDLLKRIPGVDVSRDGQITVNGQSIKTILVEGDNMFDNNYTLLSRNMSADVIDRVEIIDRYTENPLLKGIVNSNDKVINVTIKKDRKKVIFGDLDIAGGTSKRHEINANGISFYKKTKAFLFLNSNNIGRDPLPFIVNGQTNADNFNQQDRGTEKLISQSGISKPQGLQDDQTNLNRTKLGSITFLSRLSTKITVKGLMYLIGDKNSFDRTSDQFYVLNDSVIHYFENSKTQLLPLRANGYLNVTYQPKSNFLFNYAFNAKYNRTNGESIIASNSNQFSNSLYDLNQTLSHRLELTDRISDTKVFSFAGSFYTVKDSQQFDVIHTATRSLPLSNLREIGLQQFASYPVKMGNAVARLISGGDADNYGIEVGTRYKSSKLLSNLFADTNGTQTSPTPLLNPFQNNIILDRTSYYGSLSTIKSIWQNFKIVGKAEATMENINFNQGEKNQINKNYFFLTPRLGLAWKGGYHSISTLIGYNATLQEITSLFNGYVLTDYRTLKSSEAPLSPIHTLTSTFTYNYNDVLNGFTAFSTLVYLRTKGGYLTEVQLSNIFDVISRSPLENDLSNYIYAIGVNKFLPLLSSTIKLRENYTTTNSAYQANGDIYHNRSNILISDISLKTAFKGFFNSEIGLVYSRYNSTSVELNNNFQKAHTFRSFMNCYFNLSSSFTGQVNLENYHFVSDQAQTHENFFINAKGQYEVMRGKLTLGLQGKNLLNSDRYVSANINAYSKQVEQYRLLGRFILFEVNYKF